MPDREQLKEKVIVIAGASSGFGKGAAREFAKAGARVVLAARREEVIEELECNALGGQALAVPTDVRRREDVELLAQDATREFRPDQCVRTACVRVRPARSVWDRQL